MSSAEDKERRRKRLRNRVAYDVPLRKYRSERKRRQLNEGTDEFFYEEAYYDDPNSDT